MATQVQIRRGTSAQVAAFTGAEGEIVVNTTNDSIHVNDGSSAGGFEMARVDGSNWAITNNISTTANISFGDNDKAIFGAGSDLQIYHDGSHSYVSDQGTGNLNIQTNGVGVVIEHTDGTNLAVFNAGDGTASLYHSGNLKLATTSTGIDVTGSVTADGFQTDTSNTSFNLLARNSTNTAVYAQNGGTGPVFEARSGSMSAGQGDVHLKVDNNGDISFYNSAGTSQSLFWDSSAESLGINDTTPENKLTVVDTDGGSGIAVVKARTPTTNGRASYQIGNDADNWFMGIDGGNSDAFFIADAVGSSDKLVITQGGNVGIGTSSPNVTGYDSNATVQTITGALRGILELQGSSSAADVMGAINFYSAANLEAQIQSRADSGTFNGNLEFITNGAERMRIDSSGNLLVGQTSVSASATGMFFRPGQESGIISDGDSALQLNRLTNDGAVLRFFQGGTSNGFIGTNNGGLYIYSPRGNDSGLRFASNAINPCDNTGSDRDNVIDLGSSSARFDDIFATNGTIQTSDRNEKQDIEALSDAEQRVAVAAKGLLRKFRWIDSVEAKGDEARIHFGIIAQDLQDAFTAEGLDAGRYAMFINSTWTDEETGEERSRMGVRYSELLAFIISAI